MEELKKFTLNLNDQKMMFKRTQCDIDSEVDVQNINESLIPNSSNQTIKQSYTYDYQISGQVGYKNTTAFYFIDVKKA